MGLTTADAAALKPSLTAEHIEVSRAATPLKETPIEVKKVAAENPTAALWLERSSGKGNPAVMLLAQANVASQGAGPEIAKDAALTTAQTARDFAQELANFQASMKTRVDTLISSGPSFPGKEAMIKNLLGAGIASEDLSIVWIKNAEQKTLNSIGQAAADAANQERLASVRGKLLGGLGETELRDINLNAQNQAKPQVELAGKSARDLRQELTTEAIKLGLSSSVDPKTVASNLKVEDRYSKLALVAALSGENVALASQGVSAAGEVKDLSERLSKDLMVREQIAARTGIEEKRLTPEFIRNQVENSLRIQLAATSAEVGKLVSESQQSTEKFKAEIESNKSLAAAEQVWGKDLVKLANSVEPGTGTYLAARPEIKSMTAAKLGIDAASLSDDKLAAVVGNIKKLSTANSAALRTEADKEAGALITQLTTKPAPQVSKGQVEQGQGTNQGISGATNNVTATTLSAAQQLEPWMAAREKLQQRELDKVLAGFSEFAGTGSKYAEKAVSALTNPGAFSKVKTTELEQVAVGSVLAKGAEFTKDAFEVAKLTNRAIAMTSLGDAAAATEFSQRAKEISAKYKDNKDFEAVVLGMLNGPKQAEYVAFLKNSTNAAGPGAKAEKPSKPMSAALDRLEESQEVREGHLTRAFENVAPPGVKGLERSNLSLGKEHNQALAEVASLPEDCKEYLRYYVKATADTRSAMEKSLDSGKPEDRQLLAFLKRYESPAKELWGNATGTFIKDLTGNVVEGIGKRTKLAEGEVNLDGAAPPRPKAVPLASATTLEFDGKPVTKEIQKSFFMP